MIRIAGSHFEDEHGRRLMLRGVNLGGSSKIPYTPNGATYIREGFFDHRHVSFLGRPFPLAEADEHFSRLREWGLTFLRFLVTWEAIEHAGPNIYDEGYLDYIRELVKKAGTYGISMFIDPHQDVWSRFTGGDGAPGWTLEAVGLDMTKFAETGAAIVHASHGDPFPRMIWPTNGSKLAAATMFTLFFGGNDFAPRTKVDGEPVQEFLQRHYFKAVRQVVERLKDLDNVVGYDTFNEPLAGYIGWQDLNQPGGIMLLGECPTPYQAMLLGSGMPQEVGIWELGLTSLKRTRTRLLNAGKTRAWKDGCACIWREHGVWDLDNSGTPQLLRSDYFAKVKARPVSFEQDYYYPFARRFAQAVHAIDPDAMIFIEGQPNRLPPHWTAQGREKLVFAPHWYDDLTLIRKTFTPFMAIDSRTLKPVWLPGNIRKSFAAQLDSLKRDSDERLGGAPVVLGEFGVPFDMENKRAYRTGNFRNQIRALDRTFRALEANYMDGTLWNYTADNTNARGDLWNDEDLSLFSRDQQTDPSDISSGGRSLQAAVRPYPLATAGEPLRLAFNMQQRIFEFSFRHAAQISEPTEIFVPRLQYPQGFRVEVSDGRYEVQAGEQRVLYWHALEEPEHNLRITPIG